MFRNDFEEYGRLIVCDVRNDQTAEKEILGLVFPGQQKCEMPPDVVGCCCVLRVARSKTGLRVACECKSVLFHLNAASQGYGDTASDIRSKVVSIEAFKQR